MRTASRIPRIGFFQTGSKVEERICSEGVTIGRAPGNTIVLPGGLFRDKFDLIVRDPATDSYYLQITDGMTGRISLCGESAREFAELKRKCVAVPCGDDVWKINLLNESRGKIEVVGTTVLFQMIFPTPKMQNEMRRSRGFCPIAALGRLLSRLHF